jgi:hypothetical protein
MSLPLENHFTHATHIGAPFIYRGLEGKTNVTHYYMLGHKELFYSDANTKQKPFHLKHCVIYNN